MNVAGILKQADIFVDFSDEQIRIVASICQQRSFEVGDILFEENSASDELYIIAGGEVEILVDPSLVSDRQQSATRPTTIATLRRGQSFGEIALVDQGLRTASARIARPDTLLVIIPRDALMQLCDQDPILGFHLMHNLAADLALKIRNTDLMMREKLLYAR